MSLRSCRSFVPAGILAGLLSTVAAAQSADPPWLAPVQPNLIEWLVLNLQADYGDPEFGENGLTVSFHLGPGSAEEGIVFCQILYLPRAGAELIAFIEQTIRQNFEIRTKNRYPWATLQIASTPAEPDAM